jgi:hypothetical protein
MLHFRLYSKIIISELLKFYRIDPTRAKVKIPFIELFQIICFFCFHPFLNERLFRRHPVAQKLPVPLLFLEKMRKKNFKLYDFCVDGNDDNAENLWEIIMPQKRFCLKIEPSELISKSEVVLKKNLTRVNLKSRYSLSDWPYTCGLNAKMRYI